MPQARKTTPARPRAAATTRRGSGSRPQFKEPAALKRFSRSLETADSALMELRTRAGRDVGDGARELYRDLQRFLSTARRDSRKLSSALRRDFEQASRELERSQRQLTARKPAATTRKTTQRKAKAKAR